MWCWELAWASGDWIGKEGYGVWWGVANQTRELLQLYDASVCESSSKQVHLITLLFLLKKYILHFRKMFSTKKYDIQNGKG
jgi:hypothetical protein